MLLKRYKKQPDRQNSELGLEYLSDLPNDGLKTIEKRLKDNILKEAKRLKKVLADNKELNLKLAATHQYQGLEFVKYKPKEVRIKHSKALKKY